MGSLRDLLRIPRESPEVRAQSQPRPEVAPTTPPTREILGKQCPYCQADLIPVPQRKKKCPACGQPIYVKRRLGEEVRRLVTEDQAAAVEAQWAEYHEKNRIDGVLKQYDISRLEWDKRRAQGHSEGDIIWGTLNSRILAAMKHSDWAGLRALYFEAALFRHNEGREFFTLLQESARCELRDHQRSGLEKVEILTAGAASCSACRPLHGKVYTLQEALDKMPIPVRDCQHDGGWCRCTWLAVVGR